MRPHPLLVRLPGNPPGPKMSSPPLEARRPACRAQEETRSAALHLSQRPAALPARPPSATPQTKCPLRASEPLPTRGKQAARAAEQRELARSHHTSWQYRDKTHNAVALPSGQPSCLRRGPQAKEGEGSRTCPSAAPDPAGAQAARRRLPRPPARPSPRSRRAGGQAAAPAAGRAEAGGSPAGQRRSARRPPPRPPPAAPAHLSSDRLSASSSFLRSLPLAAAARGGPEPRAPRSGAPGAALPSAGSSSRCHLTPTSRRRRPQLLLLNSRRSGDVKSSSPPPPRAAALRSRRGGGRRPLRPAARAPRGPGAPPLPAGPALPRYYTHPAAREAVGGRTALQRRGCGSGVPPRARRQDGLLRPAPAFPSRESPPRAAGSAPLQPPATGPRRPAQPGRTGRGGEERVRAGSRRAARPEPRESLPPGELCVCASLL